MPSAALLQLESLLHARKLDHTLASQRGDLAGEPTSSGTLNDLPRGQISEIVGPRSSGRQTVLVSWLAAATARRELTALVDPLDMFDPPSAAACGVDLARLLWVRGRALGPDRVSLPREAGELRVQVEQAVKALNLILQASGFGLVALDLGEVPLPVIGRLPFTTWRRLHRVIAGGETACVIVAGESLARSVGGVTLALEKSATSALFPRPHIAGRLIHARGMRTEEVVWSEEEKRLRPLRRAKGGVPSATPALGCQPRSSSEWGRSRESAISEGWLPTSTK